MTQDCKICKRLNGSLSAERRRNQELMKRNKDEDALMIQWLEEGWADIEISHQCVQVFRLEPGQGEHRVFEGRTFREAVKKAMESPAFSGERIPEWRDRCVDLKTRLEKSEARIKELEDQLHKRG